MGEAREVLDRLTYAITDESDVRAAGECYAEDAVMVTPDHGEIKGRAEIMEWWRQMAEAIPQSRYTTLAKYESGSTAIDEGFWGGENTGPITMPGGRKLAATGKSVRIRGCDVATVENGYILHHRIYFDQLEFLSQLGMAPS